MRWTFWASAALMGVLLAAATFSWISSVTTRRDRSEQTQQALLEHASLAALQVDAEKVKAISSLDHLRTPEYRALDEAVLNVRKVVPGLAECFILRLADSQAKVIVDSGRSVNLDSEVIHEQYTLLDDFAPVPTEMLYASISKQTQVETTPVIRGGVAIQRAYAPILDHAGHVAGILVLSKQLQSIAFWDDPAVRMVIRVAAAVMIIGFIAIQILRQLRLVERRRFAMAWLTRSKFMKWSFVDIAIVLMAILSLAFLKNEFSVQQDLSGSLSAAQARLAQLTEQTSGTHPIAGASREQISNTLVQEEAEVQNLKARMEAVNRHIMLEFVIIGLCAAGAFIALRRTLRQGVEMRETKREANWHRMQHEQLASGLPIGFFATEASQVVFANASMDAITDRNLDEDAHTAFVKSLHPEDREDVLRQLAAADESGEAFELTFRVGSNETAIKTVEVRGVPIFDPEGRSSRLVACALDVSPRIRAQVLAERRQRETEEANRNLRHALEAGEKNFEATVDALVKAVEAKDVYTAGHSGRVMDYSVRIGRAMGLSDSQLRTLKMGTLIHDVGKIGIPDSILTKPDKLTKEEFAFIRQHPEIGVRMIECIPAFAECIPIVLYHHERMDGRGYPYGLKAESLSLMVRIATVADCFDAITSDRAYRKGASPEQALSDLALDAEKGAIDGKIVAVLADIVLSGEISRFKNAA